MTKEETPYTVLNIFTSHLLGPSLIHYISKYFVLKAEISSSEENFHLRQ